MEGEKAPPVISDKTIIIDKSMTQASVQRDPSAGNESMMTEIQKMQEQLTLEKEEV